jgi:predicted PurR-regulated permease PerM
VTTPTSGRDFVLRTGGGWTRGRVVFLAVSGAFVLGVLLWAHEVMLPFLLALIIAYVLTPLVAWAERRRVPRGAAILIVYATTLSGLYFSVALIAPRIQQETQKLVSDAPALANELSTTVAPKVEAWVQGMLDRAHMTPAPPPPGPAAPAIEIAQQPDGSLRVDIGAGLDVVQHGPGHWRVGAAGTRQNEQFSVSQLAGKGVTEAMGYVKANALELIHFVEFIVRKIARGIFLLFMTLMVAGYIMHTREAIIEFFRSLSPPNSRLGFDHLLSRVDRGLSGVVRGQLLICLMNGVISAIGFGLFGLKYWPILAMVAGVMSIVPIFGSIASSVPVVLIGLTQSFWVALWVLLWIIGVHQIEANLLNPKIIGVAAKIHPVLVVMSLIIGEHFFGLWGALLGVPALSIAQSVFNHFRFESMPDLPPDSLVPARVAPRA